ncbi:hypothetical protein B0H10DRAFT_878100 [Mycena sp. CBHHK59/15]|nr:hypothetical protein B0H10DRAFT_878100 [Mycena sp. CBHHK59/15]
MRDPRKPRACSRRGGRSPAAARTRGSSSRGSSCSRCGGPRGCVCACRARGGWTRRRRGAWGRSCWMIRRWSSMRGRGGGGVASWRASRWSPTSRSSSSSLCSFRAPHGGDYRSSMRLPSYSLVELIRISRIVLLRASPYIYRICNEYDTAVPAPPSSPFVHACIHAYTIPSPPLHSDSESAPTVLYPTCRSFLCLYQQRRTGLNFARNTYNCCRN